MISNSEGLFSSHIVSFSHIRLLALKETILLKLPSNSWFQTSSSWQFFICWLYEITNMIRVMILLNDSLFNKLNPLNSISFPFFSFSDTVDCNMDDYRTTISWHTNAIWKFQILATNVCTKWRRDNRHNGMEYRHSLHMLYICISNKKTSREL